MNIKSSELSKQLHCYGNIHMYDFCDNAGHHHGSLCKQITVYKRQALSLAWALLGTFGNSWTLFGILAFNLGKTLFFRTLG